MICFVFTSSAYFLLPLIVVVIIVIIIITITIIIIITDLPTHPQYGNRPVVQMYACISENRDTEFQESTEVAT